MNGYKKNRVCGIIALILLSSMMTPSIVYGGCGCSDEPAAPVASTDTTVNEKIANGVLKLFLKTDEYKTLEKEMANRNLYPDLKNAQVLKQEYSTGTQLLEATFVDIPFKPDCDCTSVLYGRVWAAYSPCGLGAVAQVYSRNSVEDPWNEVVLGYENGQILSIDVPTTLTLDCVSDFFNYCNIFPEVLCSLFVAYITAHFGYGIGVATGIGCLAAGVYICTELAECHCASGCGSVPGCSGYPECICDPYIDCD